MVRLQVSSGPSTNISVSVVASKPLGFTFILGIDGIKALGGVTVEAQGIVSFGGVEKTICAASDKVVGINEKDFIATFDPSTKSWTAAWKRNNELSDPPAHLTQRKVFSYCGKLVGRYPVCGWLRVVSAFIRRRANLLTESWDQVICDEELSRLLQETPNLVKTSDPVHRWWNATGDEAKVWVEASSLALGVAVEMNGHVVEDANWLQKDDSSHINMSKLYASSNKKADSLTCVPQRWLEPPPPSALRKRNLCAASVVPSDGEIAELHHATGHPGIKRTLCQESLSCPKISTRHHR
ncbi:hypothetical protein E2C01_037955 [Portunus trituberculatus]|uniref:DUF7047 domain-containing protein n=1 Tax=Portunus trituberculatus TaxID=210409 RepID=A0A5B7FFG7_PORTR|nr:hypothetical protein [Portunus trituberculatus]